MRIYKIYKKASEWKSYKNKYEIIKIYKYLQFEIYNFDLYLAIQVHIYIYMG